MASLIDKCVRAIFTAGFSQEVKIWATGKDTFKAVSYYDGVSYQSEADTVEQAIVGVTAKIHEKAKSVAMAKMDEIATLAAKMSHLKVA